eukprot:2242185-Alexandrium_andersonii.AAC.1
MPRAGLPRVLQPQLQEVERPEERGSLLAPALPPAQTGRPPHPPRPLWTGELLSSQTTGHSPER